MAAFDTYNDTYNQGVTTGQNALNSFDPTSTANSQKNSFQGIYGNQIGAGGLNNIQDYTNAYAAQVAKNPQATDLYTAANDIYNVPNLQRQATYLNNQVTNAVPQAYQMARGFDVSEPQVQNQINTNLRFLQPQATAATANANTASNLASQWVNQGMLQNQMNLMPIQNQGTMINDAMARESSGFNIAAQNEMQGLISKLNAGIQLSQAEITRANELMKASQAYETAKLQAEASQNVAKLNNSNVVLPNTSGQSTYYNPFTAQAYNPYVKVNGS